MSFKSLALFVLCTFFASFLFSKSAFSQITSQSSASQVGPVTKVSFDTGYFEKTAPNRWDEFTQNGSFRFSFNEIRTTRDSVFLRNDLMRVDIELNMASGDIWAEWPGRSRHKMHKMTDVKNEAPEPQTPSTNPGSGNGIKINSVSYAGGDLKSSGQNEWADYRQDSDAVHLYELLSQSASEIYLFSDTSQRLYKIDLNNQQLFMAVNQGPMKFHSDIINFSGVSANPPTINPETPVRPGTLSWDERESCIWSGGKVERAGLAGYERCTRPYNDGGKSCADSSECEGQCRVPSDYANRTSIRGICQMDDNPFGCFAEVKNGRTEFALCAD